MARKKAVVRENERYRAIEMFRHPSSGDLISLLVREFDNASRRLKRDLRLRSMPITTERVHGDFNVRFTGISGTLLICGTYIHIVPKFILTPEALNDWQITVLNMLSRVRSWVHTYSKTLGTLRAQFSFIDHIALAFAEALENALDQEPIHIYQLHEEVSPFIRGRLAPERTVVLSFSQPHKLVCEVDYLETDNQFNHLLHWAGEHLLAHVADSQIRRKLSFVISKLPPVTRPLRLPGHLPLLLPPQYRYFNQAMEIASSLARGFSHSHQDGSVSTYGYVLDMESLFERFIEKTLLHSVNLLGSDAYESVPQDSKLYAEPITSSCKSYYTRPDNVIYRNEKPLLIVDAKYKRFGEADSGTPARPQNADIYQLFASLVAHKCDRGLLVYPRTVVERDIESEEILLWKVRGANNPVLFGATSIDISQLTSKAELKEMDEKLARTLRYILDFDMSS